MPITYPLTLPSRPGPTKIRITPHAVVAQAASPFTGQQQVYEHPGQWWNAEVELPPMTRPDAETWISFLLKLNGRSGTFLLGDLAAGTPRGIATGTPLVSGGSQTGQALVTGGWTPSTTGILKAGDYIQIDSGVNARLHKVLDDVSSDASGAATLSIWPRLRSSPADSTPISIQNARGLFRLTDNDSPWEIAKDLTYSLSFSAIEAI